MCWQQHLLISGQMHLKVSVHMDSGECDLKTIGCRSLSLSQFTEEFLPVMRYKREGAQACLSEQEGSSPVWML